MCGDFSLSFSFFLDKYDLWLRIQTMPLLASGPLTTRDGMYLVLDGELRVRLMINGKETILTALGPGECFGEIAVFDQGPRSADVIANKESILLKISSEAFDKLRRDAPELSAPILFSISKTLAARIRAENKRMKDSVSLARAPGRWILRA